MAGQLVMGTPHVKALQDAIKKELKAREYSEEEDEVMAEYVTIMLVNNKEPDAITRELTDLVGKNYDASFTDWLFAESARQIALSSGPPPSPPRPTAQQEGGRAPTQQPRQSHPLLNQALSAATGQKRTSSARSPSPSNNRAKARRTDQQPPSGPRAMQDQPPRPQRLSDRIGGRAPGRHQHRNDAIQARIDEVTRTGPQMPQQMMVDSAAAQAFAFMMAQQVAAQFGQMGMNPMMMNGMGGPNQMQPNGFQNPQHQQPQQQPFAAPAAPQPTYALPERPGSPTLCKFGLRCTQPHCRWSHPSPVATQDSGLVLSIEACRKGAKCLDADCTFSHVSPAVNTPGAANRAPPADQKPPIVHAPVVHVPPMKPAPGTVACRFGAACTRGNCPFMHPASRAALPNTFHRGLSPTNNVGPNAFAPSKNRSVTFNKPTASNPAANGSEAKQPSEQEKKEENEVAAAVSEVAT